MPQDSTKDKYFYKLQLIKIVLLFCPTLRLFLISDNVILAQEKNKKYNADKKNVPLVNATRQDERYRILKITAYKNLIVTLSDFAWHRRHSYFVNSAEHPEHKHACPHIENRMVDGFWQQAEQMFERYSANSFRLVLGNSDIFKYGCAIGDSEDSSN